MRRKGDDQPSERRAQSGSADETGRPEVASTPTGSRNSSDGEIERGQRLPVWRSRRASAMTIQQKGGPTATSRDGSGAHGPRSTSRPAVSMSGNDKGDDQRQEQRVSSVYACSRPKQYEDDRPDVAWCFPAVGPSGPCSQADNIVTVDNQHGQRVRTGLLAVARNSRQQQEQSSGQQAGPNRKMGETAGQDFEDQRRRGGRQQGLRRRPVHSSGSKHDAPGHSPARRRARGRGRTPAPPHLIERSADYDDRRCLHPETTPGAMSRRAAAPARPT